MGEGVACAQTPPRSPRKNLRGGGGSVHRLGIRPGKGVICGNVPVKNNATSLLASKGSVSIPFHGCTMNVHYEVLLNLLFQFDSRVWFHAFSVTSDQGSPRRPKGIAVYVKFPIPHPLDYEQSLFSLSPSTGSPSSKYEHRRASALLRNIQNIRICMEKKPIVSVTNENERISIKKTAYLT